MTWLRRTRGAVLRLVRNRKLSIGIGIALMLPAGWVEFGAADAPWWLEGLSLVVGATGLALVWTGLTGVGPDWIE